MMGNMGNKGNMDNMGNMGNIRNMKNMVIRGTHRRLLVVQKCARFGTWPRLKDMSLHLVKCGVII